MEVEPDAPNPLTNLVLHNVCCAGTSNAARSAVRVMHDVIASVRDQRRADAAAGIDLPFGRFNAGKLALLLAIDDPRVEAHALIDDYLLGVSTCPRADQVRSARSTFEHLRAAGPGTAGLVPHAQAIELVLKLCHDVIDSRGHGVGRSLAATCGGPPTEAASAALASADTVTRDLPPSSRFVAEAMCGPLASLSSLVATMEVSLRSSRVDLSGQRLLCLPGGHRREAGVEVRMALALRAPVCVVEAEGDDAPFTSGWLCRDKASGWRDHPLLTLVPADADASAMAKALDLPPVRPESAGALASSMHEPNPEDLLNRLLDVACGKATAPIGVFTSILDAATEEIAKELRHCLTLNAAAEVVQMAPPALRDEASAYFDGYAERRRHTVAKPAAVEAWRASGMSDRELAELGARLFERLPFRPFYAGPRWADICRAAIRVHELDISGDDATTPVARRRLLNLAIARHNTGRLLAKHDLFFRDDPQWLNDFAERVEEARAMLGSA